MAEFGKADGRVVHVVELRMNGHQVFAEGPGPGGLQGQVRGQVPAENQTREAFHQVEGLPEQRGILAVGQGPGRIRKRVVDAAQNVEFPSHVVSGPRLRAGRWPAKHVVLACRRHEVGQVGGAAGKLPDRYPARSHAEFLREKPGDGLRVELLARPWRAGSGGVRHPLPAPSSGFRRRRATAIRCTSSGPS